ncbi:putative riboflavin [Rosellinia necatrix]|uniref:Putative riboflavin n=1 Tax=Rosellinia necatrix TaxID=77044 RepID=A0A1S7UMX3_ROSNE|nr:putative riboflavin [Rosellinia necatrix]
MPVISLPVQQPHNILSPSLIPLGQARFLLTLAAALVGPIALLALAVTFSRKYKTSNRPTLADLSAAANTGERSYLPKQSRELNLGQAVMSANRKPEVSPFVARRVLDEEVFGGKRDLSRSPSGRRKGQEERRVPRVDTEELQDFKARPPPPIPLAPPVLSTTFFSLQDRRVSVAASTNGDFDPTIAHGAGSESNPSESATVIVPNLKASSPLPLRKSYATIYPADPPQLSSASEAETDDSSSAFAPSSFPSSSPIFPLAPHAALEPREMDISGEMASAAGDSGASWKRHTRVYGGGVCLACLASGGNHGGFYGENVPLDQRR